MELYYFSITQILRENNIGYSRSAKSAILKDLEFLCLDSCESLHFLKTKFLQNQQSSVPQKWQRRQL